MNRAPAPEDAIRLANQMNLRGGILRFLEDAEQALPEAPEWAALKVGARIAAKAARGAQRAALVAERILDVVAKGMDPMWRALVGLGVAIVAAIVSLVYDLHRAALKRRRKRRAKGGAFRKPLSVSARLAF